MELVIDGPYWFIYKLLSIRYTSCNISIFQYAYVIFRKSYLQLKFYLKERNYTCAGNAPNCMCKGLKSRKKKCLFVIQSSIDTTTHRLAKREREREKREDARWPAKPREPAYKRKFEMHFRRDPFASNFLVFLNGFHDTNKRRATRWKAMVVQKNR